MNSFVRKSVQLQGGGSFSGWAGPIFKLLLSIEPTYWIKKVGNRPSQSGERTVPNFQLVNRVQTYDIVSYRTVLGRW